MCNAIAAIATKKFCNSAKTKCSLFKKNEKISPAIRTRSKKVKPNSDELTRRRLQSQ